jgi:hypothetical protein
MVDNAEAELEAAIDKVLASKARKKLVVAGPGAGKTKKGLGMASRI